MILEEFDESKKAVLNPEELISKIPEFPQVGVSCFSITLFNRIKEIFNPRKITETRIANMVIDIYEVTYNDKNIALYVSPVGASTCTAVYEDLIAMGLKKLVLFGTCGVLDRNIDDCSIIVPNVAIRDEGTSYHYMKPSDEVEVNITGKEKFESILQKHNYTYTEGKVWTTDAPYRETREKVKRRKEAGCICVDMECSAMAAVANFRGCEVFQFFYAADNLDSDNWDARSLGGNIKLDEKEKIALLSMEMAAIL